MHVEWQRSRSSTSQPSLPCTGKVPSLPAPFTNGESPGDTWVVVDVILASHLGDPLRRMRETVLLTSFRAHRAEELIQELSKKARGKGLRLQSPTSAIPEEEEEEEEKEVRPFRREGGR